MKKKPPIPKPSRRRWRSAFVFFSTIVAISSVILALNWSGSAALRQIGGHGRYRARFADIRCDSPSGMDHAVFLTEVRYLSGFPETFHPLDEAERAELAEAFRRHPWVERVNAVEVEPGNMVRVQLAFRVPVLMARVEDGVRLVDAQGILLPQSDPPPGVVELVTVVPSPKVNAGESWPNEMVREALDLMKSYSLEKLERSATGWRLTRKDGTSLHIEK